MNNKYYNVLNITWLCCGGQHICCGGQHICCGGQHICVGMVPLNLLKYFYLTNFVCHVLREYIAFSSFFSWKIASNGFFLKILPALVFLKILPPLVFLKILLPLVLYLNIASTGFLEKLPPLVLYLNIASTGFLKKIASNGFFLKILPPLVFLKNCLQWFLFKDIASTGFSLKKASLEKILFSMVWVVLENILLKYLFPPMVLSYLFFKWNEQFLCGIYFFAFNSFLCLA